MPFQSDGKIRKCKYCENPAKINYNGIKRRHKGYLRTCGSKNCLHKQYEDTKVNNKKKFIARNIHRLCGHCGEDFIAISPTQKWCIVCAPDNVSRAILRRYGLNKKETDELFLRNKGLCPICLKNQVTVIDHCHITGKTRGALCQGCNARLAIVEDENILQRALDYLGSWL